MSVDMDVVDVKAACLPVVLMCTAQSREALHIIHINGHDRTITVILAKHCIKLPDDGSLVIRNTLEQF